MKFKLRSSLLTCFPLTPNPSPALGRRGPKSIEWGECPKSIVAVFCNHRSIGDVPQCAGHRPKPERLPLK